MKEQILLNIGSTYGIWGPDHRLYEGTSMGNPAYAASKAGLIQLTRWSATTLAKSVRVNTLSPGGVLEIKRNFCKKIYRKNSPRKNGN